jgi:hypothetical protein
MVSVPLEHWQLQEGQEMALLRGEDLLAESIWSSQLSTDRPLVDVDGNLPLVAGLGLGFRVRKPWDTNHEGVSASGLLRRWVRSAVVSRFRRPKPTSWRHW